MGFRISQLSKATHWQHLATIQTFNNNNYQFIWQATALFIPHNMKPTLPESCHTHIRKVFSFGHRMAILTYTSITAFFVLSLLCYISFLISQRQRINLYWLSYVASIYHIPYFHLSHSLSCKSYIKTYSFFFPKVKLWPNFPKKSINHFPRG